MKLNFFASNKLILAPMAGITDHAFRRICREEECGLVFSEMLNARGLVEIPYSKLREMEASLKEDKPLAVQIFGSQPEVMARAGKIAQDYFAADMIDINMGCPAPKILKNKEGGWLMRSPALAKEIMDALLEQVKVPVSIKIRKGWEDCLNAVKISCLAEETGVQMITVHGRTVDQGFSGKADWDIIREIKNEVTIPVVGNGDIFAPEDALQMLDHCNCDGVMVGRGAMGNPWIFRRTKNLIESGSLEPPPSLKERINKAARHLDYLILDKGEVRGVKEMRKHTHWYVKSVPGAVTIRNKVNKAATKQDFLTLFEEIKAQRWDKGAGSLSRDEECFANNN